MPMSGEPQLGHEEERTQSSEDASKARLSIPHECAVNSPMTSSTRNKTDSTGFMFAMIRQGKVEVN